MPLAEIDTPLEEEQPQEVAEQVTPEPEEQQQEPEEKKQTTVPYGALKEERDQRKALQQQVKQMEDRFRAFMERAEPKEEKVKIPAYEENPAEHLRARLEETEKMTRAQLEAMKKGEETQAHQQAQQQFIARFQAQEHAFSQAAPDYFDAVEWLKNERLKQYVELGYEPDEAASIINWEAHSQASALSQKGLNAPERFYRMAKAAGYRGRTDKLATVAKGVERAQGAGTRGASGKDRMSLADLANVTDEEFDKLTAGGNWKRLWK